MTARRQGRAGVSGPIAVMLDVPDVLWAGRTAANPVLLLNEPLIGALRSGPFKTPAPAYRP